ncbi:MAG: putative N6-adenine-specific methylase containing domain protein [Labilithrix sp.]|nr:putative N6-adenine-specific methylase containing domain protein [Labilithrix sp.]
MSTSKPPRAPVDTTADLATRLSDPGFTPSVRRLGELLALFGHEDEDTAKSAERAVLRIESQYASRVASEIVTHARTAERPARGRLTHLAGRLAHEDRDPEGAALGWLVEALADADPKTRRAAARGLGKLDRTDAIESALAAAYDRAPSEDDRRALAIALGKMGGDAARERLAGGEHGRASVIVDRELARRSSGVIEPARAHTAPLRIWFHTRSGLEDVLKDELGASFGRARFVAPGIVEAELDGPLSKALAIRTAIHIGFPLTPVTRGEDVAADIVKTLASPETRGIFRSFTSESGTIRFRIALVRGGHRRALVWRIAELVRSECPELVNDPTASPWEVAIDEVGTQLKIELVPRGQVDERFAYRQDLVAASSHPAIAAALARVAPRRADDIVWDPFAGAGAELIERARLGPYAKLLGTDLDGKAVAAARANLKRAGIEATIEEADACAFAPEGVSLILSNPPMGRRVQRGTHGDLLERFVAHAARVLAPGGALVWLVPEPRRIRERAEAAGLHLDQAFSVDMGGFSAELAVYVKRLAKKKTSGEPKRRIVGVTARPDTKPKQKRRSR